MPNQPRPGNPARALRVEDELWQAAKVKAKENGETVSDVLRRCLETYVEEAMTHNAENDAPASDKFARVAETITRDRMAHYGYRPEQIKAAEEWPGHEASGCAFDTNGLLWSCFDEYERPRHPDRDELERTAEFVVWVLEHPALHSVIPPDEKGAAPEWRDVLTVAENQAIVAAVHSAGDCSCEAVRTVVVRLLSETRAAP